MLQETLPQPAISPPEPETDLPPATSSDQKIDLMDVATMLLREKKTIFKFILITALLTAIVVFFVMKPDFTAQASFLPPQNAPGAGLSQVASQLGSLAMGSLVGLKTPGDVYLGILQSRTIADTLIKQFDLQRVYHTKRLSDAEKILQNNSVFMLGKNTLITISVEDHDPKRATDMANAYLDALREQNGKLALTESGERRLFFEQQLEREKNALADAEVDLKRTEEQTGVIAPVGQAQMVMDTMAQIRAQITSLQVQLAAVKQGATEENPQVIRLQIQISGLQQELARLQDNSSTREPGNVQLPTAKVPELALEYVRKQREVKYHETLFELLAKQYESARLDEARDAPVLQIVDRATLPDKKSGPHRLLLTVLGALAGAFVGVIWVLWRNLLGAMKKDPIRAGKLEALREAAKGI
jgi:tyrosine-protein kinase Etk/Wzc